MDIVRQTCEVWHLGKALLILHGNFTDSTHCSYSWPQGLCIIVLYKYYI
jgi:hypothetical protein